MIFKIIPISLVLLCTTEGLKYGYQRYGRFYGKNPISPRMELPDEQPITPKLPVNELVNLCPQIVCPLIHLPEKCRKETFINTYGVLCKGCDQNVCDKNGNFDNTKLDPGSLPLRGDIAGLPNSLQQFNGGNNPRWMDTTPLKQNSAMFGQNEWQGSLPVHNNIHWQNNIPVWQNGALINNQLQNVPLRAQWQDNVPFNTQWQDNVPLNTQWQNNGLSHAEWLNNAPVNNQINNWQNHVPRNNHWLAGNHQWQNTPPFTTNNHWQDQEQKMKRLTFLGDIVQNIPPAKIIHENPWERVPFQTPFSNNRWQNVPTIPRDHSVPVFNKDGSIGSPISGLPMQIAGKSIDSEPIHMKSDQNLGFTNPLYGQITFGNIGDSIRNTVYEENSPGGFKNMVLGQLGGK